MARPGSTPRLCVLTTADEDKDQHAIRARFEAAFADSRYELSVLGSFDDPSGGDVDAHLAAQDVIWVDRGSRRAIRTGEERLPTDLLDRVKIDEAAETARRELDAAMAASRLNNRRG